MEELANQSADDRWLWVEGISVSLRVTTQFAHGWRKSSCQVIRFGDLALPKVLMLMKGFVNKMYKVRFI